MDLSQVSHSQGSNPASLTPDKVVRDTDRGGGEDVIIWRLTPAIYNSITKKWVVQFRGYNSFEASPTHPMLLWWRLIKNMK